VTRSLFPGGGNPKDPRFLEKFCDVVGLYVDPPAHAVVLLMDEMSRIQALDRTQGDEVRLPSACLY
jgi:hypothetical protein